MTPSVRRGPPRKGFLAVVTALAVCLAGSGSAAAAAPTVPLGTSIWWACMNPAFDGSFLLRCPQVYDARYPTSLARAGAPYRTIVPENEMKMLFLQPKQGKFDFRLADEIVAYAQSHAMTVRGHTLVYGSNLPRWMTIRGDWTRDTLSAAMKQHITAVMQHYRNNFPGVIREWDVVNEAIDDNGNIASNLLSRVIGSDYVELAFRYAREADPDALLYYNDYNADQPNKHSAAIIAMAKDFVKRGVPLNGIGMQMHLGMSGPVPTSTERLTVMDQYADLGLRVAITELDIGTLPPFGTATPAQQQAGFEQIARDCANLPACSGMTVWGVGDALSWRGLVTAPLLLDSDYRPKPALKTVESVLAAAPARAPTVRAPSGESLLAPVAVVDVPRSVSRTTLLHRGVLVHTRCSGTPPCTALLALSANKARLATRRVVVSELGGHSTRLRLSKAGKRRARALQRSTIARLRVRLGAGPYVSRAFAVPVPARKRG